MQKTIKDINDVFVGNSGIMNPNRVSLPCEDNSYPFSTPSANKTNFLPSAEITSFGNRIQTLSVCKMLSKLINNDFFLVRQT